MDSPGGNTVAVDPVMDTNTKESSFDSLSSTPSINEPAGTFLDPIVLDDDNDGMAPKSTLKGREPMNESVYSTPMPKIRRRLISVNNENNEGFATPRRFTDLLHSEDEDDIRLRNEVATLKTDVSRLTAELEAVRSGQSEAQLQVKNLSTERSKLLETVQQLEGRSKYQKALEDKLRCVQSENNQVKQTKEALQQEVLALRQTVQEHKVTRAQMMIKLQMAEKHVSAIQGDIQRLHKEKSELLQRANSTLLALKKSHERVTAELERMRNECAALPELRSKLVDAETQLLTTTKEAEEKVSDLQSQLSAAEKGKATLKSRVVEIAHIQAAFEEEKGKLAADSRSAVAKMEEEMKSLQLSLDSTKKAHENAVIARNHTLEQLKGLTEERPMIWRRLETTDLENKRLREELSEATQELSRLKSIESNFQMDQQQIDLMNDHMARCPFVQETNLWDNCVNVAREVSEILGTLNGGSDESPTESYSTPHQAPGPSGS